MYTVLLRLAGIWAPKVYTILLLGPFGAPPLIKTKQLDSSGLRSEGLASRLLTRFEGLKKRQGFKEAFRFNGGSYRAVGVLVRPYCCSQGLLLGCFGLFFKVELSE